MLFEQRDFPVPPVTRWPLPRAVRVDEWAALRTAVNEVFRPGGGDLFRESPLLFDPANRDRLRVIVVDSGMQGQANAPDQGEGQGRGRGGLRIVAHAGSVVRDAVIGARRRRIACVGGVFTAADHRGQGLASRVLLDVLRQATPDADVVMVSGDRGLYRRHGLRPVPSMARFDLSTLPAATNAEVRPASKGDLQTMAALYDAEDVHFIRPAADWDRLWEAGCLLDAPAFFTVVLRGGVMVGYVVAQRAGRRANGSRRSRRILESAGDRDAILDAAPALADELVVPAYDSATISACARRGWTQAPHAFPVTAATLTADATVIPWYGLNYL